MDNQKDQSNVPTREKVSLFQVALAFCEEMEIKTSLNRDEGYIWMYLTLGGATVRSYIHAEEEAQNLIIRTYAPVNVPENARANMAELITRINFATKHGCFTMDYSDGELVFKTTISVMDAPLSISHVRNVVYVNLMTMERWLPTLMSTMYGDISAERAFRSVFEAALERSVS